MRNKIRSIKRLLIVLALAISVCFVEANAQRSVLTGSDLTYMGAFQMPNNVGSYGTAWGCCLALRLVNGQVRLFSTGYISSQIYPLYEVTPPSTLTATAPWNTATLVRDWYASGGNVFTDQDSILNGIYWDPNSTRLYYSSSSSYQATGDPYAPSLSFLTLNDSAGTAASDGLWGFTNLSFKMANFGLTGVPSDFQSQYSVGSLAAGFGGYQSVMAFGPTSSGPALAAFSPPVAGHGEGGYLANTPLVGYPYSSVGNWLTGQSPAGAASYRPDDILMDYPDGVASSGISNCQNPINFIDCPYTSGWAFEWQGYSITGNSRSSYPTVGNTSTIDTRHWVPGNAFWASDGIYQSGAWIQTPDKEGIVFLAKFQTGRIRYQDSNSSAFDAHEEAWLIYSRAQFGSVASGAVAENQIQAARYMVQFPGVPSPAPGSGANAYLGTSTTSMTIGNSGPVTFTTQAGLAFTPGMYIEISNTSNDGDWMSGQLTSYSGTSMTVNLSGSSGSGAYSNWFISGSNSAIGWGNPVGMAYDSVNQNLYVLFDFTDESQGPSVVYVYHVD